MRLNLSILPICEGYGRVVDMEYGNPGTPGDHRSAKPTVLQLGNWRHPKTKNMLVGGINLGYLSDIKKLVLRRYLPDILASKNLKGRYWAGRLDVPNRLRKLGKKESANELAEIFAFYYRTYNKAHVNTISTKTLRFMSPSELKALGDTENVDALKDKANEITAIRKEIEAIRDAGGDASDLEKKLGVALGELPVKARKKLEKPPEPPPPVSPRMGAEPKAPEAEPETVKDRAQDAVDSNVARDNIAQLDPDDKEALASVEPTKDDAEPEEDEKPEITKPEEEPEIEMSSTDYEEDEDEGVKPKEEEEPEIEMSSTDYEEDEE